MTQAYTPDLKNKKYEEIICKVCFKKFIRCKIKSRGRKLPAKVRGKGSVTCSSKCSKENTRYSRLRK